MLVVRPFSVLREGAGCVSVRRRGPNAALPRKRKAEEPLSRVFHGVRVSSLRRTLLGLENRKRRKSFVGLNPTPSALFSREVSRQSSSWEVRLAGENTGG